jgi:uncharacterized protein YecT (DUF1311 family)
MNKHPIEKALEDCIDHDSGTAGMTNCAYKALEMWDKELNKIYDQLFATLAPEGKQAQKAAQIEWIKHRDAIYSQLQGTMYIPLRVEDRMEIVKTRAVALKKHLDFIKEQ